MKIIVQKFGGTSVATKERRIKVAEHVMRAISEGYRPVVVVSAMGRLGDPYATDTLVELIQGEVPDPSPRELDMLMACGEIIACTVVAQSITAAGQPAIALTGGQAGIITDDTFGNARILEVNTEHLTGLLEKGKIPVVAGFQGITSEGDITTLGRGGSDTSAVALGVALKAQWVEIYTDVSGVMTADPRLEPNAQTLQQLTYQEVTEMAHLGAKVIHPRAVEIAAEGRLPVHIRSLDSKETGTIITARGSVSSVPIFGDRVVTGIAHVDRLAHVELYSDGNFNDGLGVEVFRTVAEAGISIDVIHMSPHLIAFNVEEIKVDAVTRALEGLGLSGKVKIEPGYAKVSAVGAGMRGVPGVMSRIISALHRAGCHVYQTTDSHANISCLVKQSCVQRAIQALHQEFGLNGKRQ